MTIGISQEVNNAAAGTTSFPASCKQWSDGKLAARQVGQLATRWTLPQVTHWEGNYTQRVYRYFKW